MRLLPIPAPAIPREWGWMAAVLAPAIERERWTSLEVRNALMRGEMTAWQVVGPEADALIVTLLHPVRGTARLGFWALYAAGKASGGPKVRLTTYRRLIAELERIARACGAEEFWIEARHGWGRALDGFEIINRTETHTDFRKAL